jgi:hypothetical protein
MEAKRQIDVNLFGDVGAALTVAIAVLAVEMYNTKNDLIPLSLNLLLTRPPE